MPAEGDYNLLGSGEYFDPHAVAGLLKTFLRELPSHVLTRELQPAFNAAAELPRHADQVNELGRLVALLPTENYMLLRFLCAHLKKVCDLHAENRMPLRNVGIVFSPTLAIPPTLFTLLVSDCTHIWAVRRALS